METKLSTAGCLAASKFMNSVADLYMKLLLELCRNLLTVRSMAIAGDLEFSVAQNYPQLTA